uniref:Uncharacterized protein n=1 Tax=Rhizophagus irregularis (strain DAOM 181602 / DAOM 197198 / MUCL 43194) TaxID=747089 RepID=U9UMI1_RHIID
MARVQTISTFFMESNIATKDISGRQGISKDEYTNKTSIRLEVQSSWRTTRQLYGSRNLKEVQT